MKPPIDEARDQRIQDAILVDTYESYEVKSA
jgi:hypothetical protein